MPLKRFLKGWIDTLRASCIVVASSLIHTTLDEWNQGLNSLGIHSVPLDTLSKTRNFVKPDISVEREHACMKEIEPGHFISGPRVRLLLSCCVTNPSEFHQLFVNLFKGEILLEDFHLRRTLFHWKKKLLYDESRGYGLRMNGNLFIYFDVIQLACYLHVLSKSSAIQVRVGKFSGHQDKGLLFFRLQDKTVIICD